VGSFNNAITQFQQLRSVSARLRRRLLGDARNELAAAVTDHLLVFGSTLHHLESGKSQPLADNSQLDAIAAAAKLLIGKGGDQCHVKLYLPPSEFIATTTQMPGVSSENLESALMLQRDTLLPAYEGELALATTFTHANDNGVVALWIQQQKLNQLFEAFARHKLLIATVQPRNLCVVDGESDCNVLDDDGDDLTLMSWSEGALVSWLPVKKRDLEQDAFKEQWHELLDPLTNVIEVTNTTTDHYEQSEPVKSADYCFFPDGAIAARKKVEKSKQVMLAASALVAVLVVASLPFILQSLELRMAEARLQAAREMSTDARADQSIVVEFENEWGTINDFPDQQVRQAMFRLQEVLGAERLSSLELNEGLIRIQGTSSDPQAILQRLEQDPMFTEVVFSRATNNTRYYIDLRLATVNFEAYMLRYFPDQS